MAWSASMPLFRVVRFPGLVYNEGVTAREIWGIEWLSPPGKAMQLSFRELPTTTGRMFARSSGGMGGGAIKFWQCWPYGWGMVLHAGKSPK